MGASEKDIMTARLFFRAAFPVMKVPLNDDPKIRKLFESERSTDQNPGPMTAIRPSVPARTACRLSGSRGTTWYSDGSRY